ncbi:OTU domain-containing protein 4 [Chelonia mydas]|uniref:ubiquitinyl hydrolase 1 n=1 Tax=Chelonia mydas TaxID=8469 RepID=M7B1G4_CHEMY|nr:OTU domain-containing protein 4 [Chelonia mydas]
MQGLVARMKQHQEKCSFSGGSCVEDDERNMSEHAGPSAVVLKAGCGTGGQHVLSPSLLPAAPIALEQRTMASGSHDRPNLQTRQVLHSQSLHIDVRNACINYLRKNREKFEAEWVGQVEISALSLMYKKDFIIYQEPNASPSRVTENGFPDKILLCFSNGNHYDIIYPIEYTERAALCQSLLYELLYEKVFCTDVNKILVELGVTEENNGSSEVSDSDSEDDNCKSKTAAVNDMNGLKSFSGNKHLKNNGNPISFLPRKVLKSLNPSFYRNVEYEVWLQSKEDQQKRDFSIAAGMQYSIGDKCKVRLDHNGKFYNAHIQEVCSENGPVIVFVEELGEKKPDRERAEDLDYTSRDCNYFGLSPEERRTKQAIEESRSLYEIQQRDEHAFPALSNHLVCQAAVQTADTCVKIRAVNEKRNSRWKANVEERKDKGIPTQIPVSSLMPAPTTGPDSVVSQATSAPVAGVPVSIQAVNQPLMPLPQTLNPYQDPLFPGFPFNEKGERAIAPPYSLCNTGDDLPKDRSILRFFFNLGVKGFMENSVVRPNVMSPEDKGAAVSPLANIYLAEECSSPVPVTSCVEHLRKVVSESSSSAIPLPVASLSSESDVLDETSARMPKMEQICTAVSPAKQVKAALQNHSTQMQGIERQTLVSHASPSVTEPPKNEMKSNIPGHKEKPEKARDAKATDNLQANLVESRTHRAREESSEDENEVSDMLRSGRSKQFYNQTYGGGRRPRNEWGYPSSRGGYQYPRNEEAWKGPPNRSRDEGYQYHRNFRGRPYKNDRRRAIMGDNQRGHLA